MSEKIKIILKNSLGYIMVAVVSAIYIASAFMTIEDTGKSIGEIIANGAISFFLGMVINRVFDIQGMINGDRCEKVRATNELHEKTVERISLYIDHLDDWCEKKNAENIRLQRTKILARGGLKYDMCFDPEGTALPYQPVEKAPITKEARKKAKMRYKHYKKACVLKLTPLTASELTSDGVKHEDPLFLGRTKKQYERTATLSDTISRIAMALLIGYYGVKLVENFSYTALIWTSLQTGLFILFGIVKMYKSYMFVVDEHRSRTIRKIDNLQKFENSIKNESENDNVK